MTALSRKNLIVNAEQLRELAKRLGKNESETVRHAVDVLLHEQEVVDAAEAIRRRGGLDDVFGRTSSGPRRKARGGAGRRPTRA